MCYRSRFAAATDRLKSRHLFDSVCGKLIDNGMIVIEGSKIKSVGNQDALPQNARVIDLGDAHVPLNRIAELLGYTEQSVFSRSCRRWFGATPSALRRTARSKNS
jgi:AraC-like DNA-binding protein